MSFRNSAEVSSMQTEVTRLPWNEFFCKHWGNRSFQNATK